MILPAGRAADTAELQNAFPKHYEIIPGTVWAVAGPHETCLAVCKDLKLGGLGPDNDTSGVVVKASEYYGFADRGLWDSLGAWSESGTRDG